MTRYIAALTGAFSIAAAVAQAAVQSPVGTQWDLILSGGGQQGIAFMTFYDDGTFSGYELLSSRVKKTASSDNPRGIFADADRTPGGDSSETSSTNLFGFSRVEGPWAYDNRGRVIGHFIEVVGEDGEGNPRFTNAVSFSARVVAGKRLTMLASTRNGKVTYSGVPFRETPDLSGQWNGVKVLNRQSFLEFFELTSVSVENPFGDDYPDLGEYPGIYWSVGGQGPGYDTLGFAMASSKKKIGFSFLSTPWGTTNSVMNASYGSWSSSKKGVNVSTAGAEEPLTAITFKASKALTE